MNEEAMAVSSRPAVRGASRSALLPPAEENRRSRNAGTAPGPRKTAGGAVPNKLITGAGAGNGSKNVPLPTKMAKFEGNGSKNVPLPTPGTVFPANPKFGVHGNVPYRPLQGR